ncbi:hypothetical protein [Algicola sagamiensis]|nr:hypothetical protein [Algicola sagamiensis]
MEFTGDLVNLLSTPVLTALAAVVVNKTDIKWIKQELKKLDERLKMLEHK